MCRENRLLAFLYGHLCQLRLTVRILDRIDVTRQRLSQVPIRHDLSHSKLYLRLGLALEYVDVLGRPDAHGRLNGLGVDAGEVCQTSVSLHSRLSLRLQNGDWLFCDDPNSSCIYLLHVIIVDCCR